MNKILVAFALLFVTVYTQAQDRTLLKLPIDKVVPQSDTVVVVKISINDSNPFAIKVKTMGALHRNYKNAKNFDLEIKETIGAGRCIDMDGMYHSFKLKMTHDTMRPLVGDLLSFFVDSILCYRGIAYDLNRYYISFINLEEKEIFSTNTAFYYKSKQEEDKLIEILVDDIKYTGREMLKVQPEVNYVIQKEGYVKGKKLLDFLTVATPDDVIKFLKYIQARPNKYAGNQWKIGEIFATWADSGAPTVIEK